MLASDADTLALGTIRLYVVGLGPGLGPPDQAAEVIR
jgi:hypothetical protein